MANKLKAFIKDLEGITSLQVVNVYSFSLILPKPWIDFCTDEVDFEGKPTRFVRVEPKDDTLVIRGVTKEEIANLLNTIQRKGTE